jgi:hypothetical protein
MVAAVVCQDQVMRILEEFPGRAQLDSVRHFGSLRHISA